MGRSTLRTAVAAFLLAVLLMPAAASAGEPALLSLSGERGLVAALWDFLGSLSPGAETDNRWTIDPNGATASACDNRWTIDPNGGSSCSTSDNRWTIDPNG